MNLEVYGSIHVWYLVITLSLTIVGLICAKIFAKTEKTQKFILKCIAGVLFTWIMVNRISQMLQYEDIYWAKIIPETFCGMTSLILSISVLFGKKDNVIFHFTWLLALIGDVATIFYPTFLKDGSTIFYLPTISGLFHHSISLVLVVALLMFKQINITYKKWYCTFFGFATYFSIGSFQMIVLRLPDAFNMVTPILVGTRLTAWVMAPIYIIAYSTILLIIEIVRIQINRNKTKEFY